MADTWIDMTDLLEWKGHFTGIQRVAYNYANRFAKDGARFFAYSDFNREFVEVPFNRLDQLRRAGNKRQELSTPQKLKARYKQLPLAIRRLSSPTLNLAYKGAKKTARVVFKAGNPFSGMPVVTFSKDDTVILLDAAWNRKELLTQLDRVKRLNHFRLVVHLNDILPVYETQLFTEELSERFSAYTHKVLGMADLVTVISEATKQDVQRFCNENDKKTPLIEVVRLGEDLDVTKPSRPDAKIDDNFILSLGTFEIRKNYMLLYQTVKLAQQQAVVIPQIVIAGRKGWLTHDLQYILEHDQSIQDKIILLEDMSDANITWLFDNCMFSIFCSVAEGWGLPIAESLQHGKFCLSSNTSSMPEIAGDLIDYFSPYDAGECLNKIREYTHNEKYITKNKVLKKTYRVFTWDESYSVYKKLTA